MPALGAGHQRDEQDVLGGEEGQVVGGRVGPTQPAGQKGECYGSHRTSAEGSRVGSPHRGVRPPPSTRHLSKDLLIRLSLFVNDSETLNA